MLTASRPGLHVLDDHSALRLRLRWTLRVVVYMRRLPPSSSRLVGIQIRYPILNTCRQIRTHITHKKSSSLGSLLLSYLSGFVDTG